MTLYKIIKIGKNDAYYNERNQYEGKLFYGTVDTHFNGQAWGYMLGQDTLEPITFHQVELKKFNLYEEDKI